jgi:hypothetical protein
MYIVRGEGAAAATFIRVPQAPQNANPGDTMRPQFGHTVPSTAAGAEATTAGDGVGAEAGCACGVVGIGRGAAQFPGSVDPGVSGGGVTAPSMPDATPPPLLGVMGIFGESFQGIPPLALPAAGGLKVGSGVGSLPRLPETGFASGGRMVRAVSSGAGSRVAGLGAGLISLPQPRQNL